MIGIVVSRADSASEHVGDHLLDLREWTGREDDARPAVDGGGTYYRTDGFELRTFDDLHLHLEGVARAFEDPDLIAFASRHAGETGPLLSAHFTGNFGPAEYGGESGELAVACPNALERVVAALDENAPPGYDVGMECTHHGPSHVGAPSMFVELGSAEDQWTDTEGAEAVARAILDLEGVTPHGEPFESDAATRSGDLETGSRRHVVGFGGGHYVPRFERVVRETPWAVGHVAADWALEAMGDPAENRDVLERAFAASEAEFALVEGERPALERVLADLGYRVVSETWLREVGDRSLALVERIERDLGRIDEGVRFGRDVPDENGDSPVVADLPAELLGAAEGIDPVAVRQSLESNTVAFTTTDGGSRAGDRAAVTDRTAVDDLVTDLAAILRERYDDVTVEADAVVAEERAFDPDRASAAGVPEGPKFGKLAGGEPVSVDGETVTPEEVRVDRTVRFRI